MRQKSEPSPPKQHGGKRPGAGRKPGSDGKRQSLTVTLPPSVREWLTSQAGTASATVERLVRREMDRPE